MPSNQCSWRSPRKARTCSRREWPSVATKNDTGRRAPSISTRLWPKSICNCWPGRVSNLTVARASARSAWRSGATARSTVRRLTSMPLSAASSWRTTSALPAWRRKRSDSQPPRPSSDVLRVGATGRRQPPSRSHRRTIVREHPSSAAIRRAPQPSAFSLSIADTSSGSFISSLRRPSVRRSLSVTGMVIQALPSGYRGGQFLMSPPDQFAVTPDSTEGSRSRIGSTTGSHTPARGSGTVRPRSARRCEGRRGSPSRRRAVRSLKPARAAARRWG